ncbi:hypothetical protein FQN54_003142 [Arachnomyces sp. PD_36]|nr:hypothetical protein FQN54_003142 [Arachnomyces sp. PD_36]
MPDPGDSPGSSGSSSFNPYNTPGHDDQANGSASASSRPVEYNSANHGYQQRQLGHGPGMDSMETYRSGRFEEPISHPDEMHRKRKRSPNAHTENASPYPGIGSMGSDARGRNDPDFLGGRKRARPGSNGSESMSPDGIQSGTSYDKSTLPGELWQHIFTFLPPESLGSLSLVNQAFKFLLTADDAQILARSPSEGALKYQSANSIWSISRKSFHPGMPRPLFNLTELEMWRLVRGSICQFCGKSGSLVSSTDLSPLEKDQPGDLRLVWPFGIRSCSECLEQKTEKEMDLLFSSTLPSILLPALPFALFTPSMHFISSIALRGSQSSANFNLTKYYFKPHIQAMKREFDEVKALGSATAEEWVKGLETNGKEKLADAARWEQWEMSGALKFVRAGKYLEPESSYSHTPTNHQIKESSIETGSGGFEHLDHGKAENNDSNANGSSLHGSRLPPRPSSPSSHNHVPSPSHYVTQPHRAERSLREVNEAKAGRRAEIERRCAELDPPLSVAVLSHMESFSAAIQIPHPFTDRDWGILKPRLLAQREVAERREKERVKQSQALHAKTEERRAQDAQWKEAKEALDREWDEAQKPLRDRMAAHADDIIREGWRGGDAVTKEKCPKFAADVLIYVRDRFYSDLEQDDADARAAGKPIEEDPPNGPPKRKLILENMKFIFDTKIKPLTERHQKELFLCNGCDNNAKFYGFEGVVQHYAAKHTSVLSLGSVVVHWRAEWPEKPPFHPDPDAAKALFSSLSHHMSGFPGGPGMYGPGPEHGHHPPGPYGRGPYGAPYQYPPDHYRAQSPSMNAFYAGQQGGYPYPPPPQGYPPNPPFDHHGPPPPPSPMYGSQYPGHSYPSPYAPPESRVPPPLPGSGYPPQPHGPPPYGSAYPPARGAKRPGVPQSPSPMSEPYQTQLDFTAKHARDIWNGTSGIRGLPNSVRIYVLIYNIVSKFRDRFADELTLSLFADCLNSHAQMKPVRNLNGLMCKACNIRGDYGGYHSHHNSSRSRKLYALPALVSHFQSIHIERAKPMVAPQTGMPTPGLDWKFDMIDLPDPPSVASLIHAPGMDDVKVNLFAAAFPGVFPSPPPVNPNRMAPGPNAGEKPSWSRELKRQDRFRRAPGPQGAHDAMDSKRPGDGKSAPSPNRRGLEVAVDDFPRFVDSPMTDVTKPLDPPQENEYDPHKPAFIEPIRDKYGRAEDPRSRGRHPSAIPEREGDRRNMSPEQSYGRPYEYGHQRTNSSYDRNHDLAAARGDEIEASQRAAGPSYAPSYLPRKEPPSQAEYVASGSTGRPADVNSIKRDTPTSPSKNVSEDGEVGEEPNRAHDGPLEAEPTEEMTAAERFLNGLVPEDIEMYQPKEQEPQLRDSSQTRKPVGPPEHDARRWRHGNSPGHINSARATPAQGEPNLGWRESPSAGRVYHDYAPSHDVRGNTSMGASRHLDERTPDPSDPYGRKNPPSQGSRHAVEHPSKRPSSRFDRYEAQRQTSRRPRSRSPSVRGTAPVEATYYRERSPKVRERQRPVYPGHPDDYHERVVMEDGLTYAPVPPQGQYQYVDDPRYAEPPYGAPVEYIPVRLSSRQSQGSGAYYVERPVQRDVSKEYIDYGPDYQRQPIDDPYYRPHSQQIEDPPNSMPRHVRYR